MSDFALAWNLSRHRLVETISDLSDAQLAWHLYDGALSIAQMVVHVAGVEVSFASQLLGVDLDHTGLRIKASATDGIVNDKPFPFADGELTGAKVAESLAYSKAMLEPVISNPGPEILAKQLLSALGPVITGEGAFTRLAFHAAYHQGQAYLIRTAPNFPK